MPCVKYKTERNTNLLGILYCIVTENLQELQGKNIIYNCLQKGTYLHSEKYMACEEIFQLKSCYQVWRAKVNSIASTPIFKQSLKESFSCKILCLSFFLVWSQTTHIMCMQNFQLAVYSHIYMVNNMVCLLFASPCLSF